MDRIDHIQYQQKLSQERQQPHPQHLIPFDNNTNTNKKFLPHMNLPLSTTGIMNQRISTQPVATQHQYYNLSNYNQFNTQHHPYNTNEYYRQRQQQLQLQQRHLQLVQEEQDRKLECIYRMKQEYPMPSEVNRNVQATMPPSANVSDIANSPFNTISSSSSSTTSIASPVLPVVSSSMMKEEEFQRIRMLQNYQQHNQRQWNQTAVMVQRQLFPYHQSVLNANTNVTTISPHYCAYHHLQSNSNNNGVIKNPDHLSRVANQMYHRDSHEFHNSSPSGITTKQNHVLTSQITTSAIVSPESLIHRNVLKSEPTIYNLHRDVFYTAAQGTVKQVPNFQEKLPKQRPTGSCSQYKIVLPTEDEFPSWLQQRKETWRTLYKVYQIESDCNIPSSLSPNRKRKRTSNTTEDDNNNDEERCDHVSTDFWSDQGYSTFLHWLHKRKTHWKLNYSWNRSKRQQLQQDCFEINVHLGAGSVCDNLATTSSSDRDCKKNSYLCTNSNSIENLLPTSSNTFNEWLRVRKNQWKVLRRKRQRQRLILSQQKYQQPQSQPLVANDTGTPPNGFRNGDASESVTIIRPSMMQSDMMYIDELLEEQEHNELLALEQARSRQILDLSFIFDSELGCPDDVIVHLIGYLPSNEHWKLLAINKQHRTNIIKRDDVWQQLCPKHWSLPRRPRKPWYEIYITKLNDEMVQYEKIWDDLLLSISSILSKGDCLLQVEKAIQKSEQKFNKSNNKVQHKFDINYVSGVVCERNSILNLAIIHRRHKVSKWLIETMNADIESCDRGNFTALLNAAYNGDKYLVRLLLQYGADRRKLGTSHYTKGLAPSNFIGYTAQQWAEQRGYTDVANLIRIGI